MRSKAHKHTVRFKMIKAVMFSYLYFVAHFHYAHCIRCSQLIVNNVQYYVFVYLLCISNLIYLPLYFFVCNVVCVADLIIIPFYEAYRLMFSTCFPFDNG